MSKLTIDQRNNLKPSAFGLPDEKKYPMPDKSHAVNAKARATQEVKAGKLTPEQQAKIDTKADKVIG